MTKWLDVDDDLGPEDWDRVGDLPPRRRPLVLEEDLGAGWTVFLVDVRDHC